MLVRGQPVSLLGQLVLQGIDVFLQLHHHRPLQLHLQPPHLVGVGERWEGYIGEGGDRERGYTTVQIFRDTDLFCKKHFSQTTETTMD